MANDYPRILRLLNRDNFVQAAAQILDPAIYPVIKLSTNIEKFAPLRKDMDIDAGLIMR